jgi:RHS repeat-associated protein
MGSVTQITNASGAKVAEYSYDAWGRMRNPASQTPYAPGTEPALKFNRGYTGHEHLPLFGLVNMNARLYDPVLGRFLSPDPYVQAPDYSQNFNRYSYALNNPLIYTDESGEFIFTILAAIFCQALVPAAMQLDMAWIQGGIMSVDNGDSFWSGAGKGFVTGMMNAGFSFVNVPGMMPNGLIHAGGNILTNGLTNTMYGQDFFNGWGFQAASGFAGGAYSGYQQSKERGLNYWWGGKVKYGRTQWSFFTSEKPYAEVKFGINNVGSKNMNDCDPTTFAEADDYFDGNTTYEEYKTITNYKEDYGVKDFRIKYQELLYEKFDALAYSASELENPQLAREILNSGYLINTNMPHGGNGMFHADNIRSIRYYSNKVVLHYRIGSYKLSTVDKNWWFYLLKGLK